MLPWVEKFNGFMGSAASLQEARAALLGVPLEATVSFRPGTRFGPQGMRTVSDALEEYSPALDRCLADAAFFDCGDVQLPPGNREESMRRIQEAAGALLDARKFPLFLGGEHLLSLATIGAAARRWPGMAVLHLDAHADLRSDYLGERFSHATVMRLVGEVVGRENVYQLGIRSATAEEMAYARQGGHLYLDELLAPLERQVLPALEGRPLYLSLDIDVVDPAFAPGTGTPEPGGCTAREVLQAVRLLAGRHVVAMDLVEVSPLLDPSGRTAVLAAKIVREALLALVP